MTVSKVIPLKKLTSSSPDSPSGREDFKYDT
jgi:hypothetical protein